MAVIGLECNYGEMHDKEHHRTEALPGERVGISGAFSKEEGLNAACVVIEIIQ